MSVVTLILSGIPQHSLRFALKDLAIHIDKVIDTEEIGTFRVREVNDKIAVDFNSGYDAMLAQNLLNGKPYILDDGIVKVLRARVTHDPALRTNEPVVAPSEHCSFIATDERRHTRYLKSVDQKLTTELNLLRMKKKVLLSEEQLLEKQRIRIRKQLMMLDEGSFEYSTSISSTSSDTDSSPKKRKTKKLKSKSLTPRPNDDSTKNRSRDWNDRRISKKGRDKSSLAKASTSRDSRTSPRHGHRRRSSSRSRFRSRSRSRSFSRSRSCSRSRSKDRSRPRKHGHRSRSRQATRRRWYDSREQSMPNSRAAQKAIEYRPNISELYEPPKKVYTPENDMQHESIIVEEERHIKIEMDSDKAKLDARKKEAIIEIFRDVEKPLRALIAQYGATDVDRNNVLDIFLSLVKQRLDYQELSDGTNVTLGNAVLRYRCMFSKIEDEQKITDIFQNVVLARCKETSNNQLADSALNDLDSVLKGFDPALLAIEDVKPEIEEDDEEEGDIKFSINIVAEKPNGEITPRPTKKIYTMHNPECGYFVKITVDTQKQRPFFIPIKKLLQQMRSKMEIYSAQIEIKVLKYIITIILEKRLKLLLNGIKERLKTKTVLYLFRELYPLKDDNDFIFDTLCAIFRGDYNDSTGKLSIDIAKNTCNANGNLKLKKVLKKGDPLPIDKYSVKQERDISVSDIKPKTEIVVKETPLDEEIIVLETIPDVIDLETDNIPIVKKDAKKEIDDRGDIFAVSDEGSSQTANRSKPRRRLRQCKQLID